MIRDCPQPGTAFNRTPTALAAWKYIKPADITITKTDDLGHVWKFCTKCKCRATQKVGHYQLSHLDANHVPNFCARQRATAAAAASPGTTATARSVEVAPPDTLQSNMTAIANPNLIPPGPPDVTHPEPTDNALDDDMTFTGAWCTPVDYHVNANVTVTGFFPPVPTTTEGQVSPFTSPSTSVIERENQRNNTNNNDTIEIQGESSHNNDKIANKKMNQGDHSNNNINDLNQPILMADNKETLIHPPPSQIINHIMILLFWSTALFWDTLAYLFQAPSANSVPRRTRRLKNQNIPRLIFVFVPTSWMLLTHCINLLPGFYHGLHLPTIQAITSHIIGKSTITYQCIIQLDALINLDWNALWQFNCIKGQSVNEDIFTSGCHTSPSEPFQISNLCASRYVIDCIHEDGAALLVNVQVAPESTSHQSKD